MQTWRYLPPLVASGSLQMAIDRWLLQAHAAGVQPPSLRFYRWEPAALSLGYHQRQYPERWQALATEGTLELVRRPSGGRAVLHDGDLTYAIVASGLGRRRQLAYRQLCEFLVVGWQSLGVALHYGRAGRDYARQANCFALATGADLVTAAGEKFIGSAQLWRGGTVLQHGSMRLRPDPALHARVFGTSGSLPPRSLPSQPEIIVALQQAARDCFGIQLIEQPLTVAEREEIARDCWEIELLQQS